LDIDHSISDAAWRDGLKGDWDAYYPEGDKDEPIHPMIDLVQALHACGHVIVAVTGRPEKWRSLTLTWLVRHKVEIDSLLMRPDDDYRPTPEVKLALVIDRFGHDFQHLVGLVIDDRDDVLSVFRARGVTCVQVFA
jgi:phosphoglycolate phosphatase-like HAD superfamily hydrolase